MTESIIHSIITNNHPLIRITLERRLDTINLISKLHRIYHSLGKMIVCTSVTEQGAHVMGQSDTIHDYLYLMDIHRSCRFVKNRMVNGHPIDLRRFMDLDILIINEFEMLDEPTLSSILFKIRNIQKHTARFQYNIRERWTSSQNLISSIKPEYISLMTTIEARQEISDILSQFENQLTPDIIINQSDTEGESSVLAIGRKIVELMKPYGELTHQSRYGDRVRIEILHEVVLDCFRDLANLNGTSNTIMSHWSSRLANFHYHSHTRVGYCQVMLVGDAHRSINREFHTSSHIRSVHVIDYSITDLDMISRSLKNISSNSRVDNMVSSKLITKDLLSLYPLYVRLVATDQEADEINSMRFSPIAFNAIDYSSVDGLIKISNSLNLPIELINIVELNDTSDIREVYKVFKKDPSSIIRSIHEGMVSYMTYHQESHSYEIDSRLHKRFCTSNISISPGMRVMITQTDIYSNILVHVGAIGEVVKRHNGTITIQLDNNSIIVVEPRLTYIRDHDTIYLRYQLPLKIAYAMTLEEARCIPLDKVIVDTDLDTIIPSSEYMMLSRLADSDVRIIVG